MKICGRCEVELTENNWYPSYKKKGYNICSKCENARQKAYNLANPKQKHIRNKYRVYGISFENYEKLVADQVGVCAICGLPPEGNTRTNTLYVDHNHDSNKVRGLLCLTCNTGLGMFRDSPELLNKAKEYLCLQN